VPVFVWWAGKIGAINSLGQRRDADSLVAFLPMAPEDVAVLAV
jgi:hypothetical protein